MNTHPNALQVKQSFGLMSVVLAGFLIWAFVSQPFADWGGFTYFLGGSMAVLLVVSILSVAQGRIIGGGNAFNPTTAARTKKWSIIALILFGIFMALGVFGGTLFDSPTANDVLTLGIWVYLIIYMFFSWRWASETLAENPT